MLLGEAGDFKVPVGIVFRFGGQRLVVLLLEDRLGVPFNREAAGVLLVVPVKVNTGVLLYCPVSGDSAVLFHSREEVFGVAFLHMINDEIVYY